MSEQSAKPYLIRAICEWCADNGFTPYLAVRVNRETKVPPAYVKNGEIVLNLSTSATRRLTIDNDWIQFTARFSGVSQEVAVPMAAAAGIFAKETGYGFAFNVSQDPVAALAAATLPADDARSRVEGNGDHSNVEGNGEKSRARPSHLQVVK